MKNPPASSPILQTVQPVKKLSPKQVALMALLVLSLSVNIYFLIPSKESNSTSASLAEASLEQASLPVVLPREPVSKPLESASHVPPVVSLPLKPVAHKQRARQKQSHQMQAVSFPPGSGTLERSVRSLHFQIRKSLNHTVCSILTLEEGCRQLSAYVGRILVWYLDLNREMRPGDRVSLVYEILEGEDRFHILKLKFESGFHQKTFEANYFQIPGTRYGSYFDRSGKEIHPNLIDEESPIREFTEITSLPGDYRKRRFHGHRGTDFKAPTGTPVYATFDGKVVRKNWNTRSNGYSLEIDHPRKGVKTRYLHLSQTLVKSGETVRQGQKIAESGNTGRSFAPHLHYEIEMRGSQKKLLNPFKTDKHKKIFSRIPDPRKEEFLEQVSLYNSLIQGG